MVSTVTLFALADPGAVVARAFPIQMRSSEYIVRSLVARTAVFSELFANVVSDSRMASSSGAGAALWRLEGLTRGSVVTSEPPQ
jgi:hypothetical protein